MTMITPSSKLTLTKGNKSWYPEFKQATSGLTQDIRKNDSENKEDKQM